MIKTKVIRSISTKLPADTAACKYVNVLTWHDASHANGSEYYMFSPYFLKTDGREVQANDGNVLFENFWQGSKLWPTMYDSEVWAHRNFRGNPKYLWFKYECPGGAERHLIDGEVQPEYYKWRESVFACKKPIRYPNGFARKSEVAFSLLIDANGNETRLDYITARKRIYIDEYCRLVRAMPKFLELKRHLAQGKTLIICEVDVPDNEIITIEKLERLAEDERITFGHGLCLAWELLKDV